MPFVCVPHAKFSCPDMLPAAESAWAAHNMWDNVEHNPCRKGPLRNGVGRAFLEGFSYVQELRASMNKSILQAERQLESSYVSAKAAAQKKWADVKSEL